MKTRTAIIASLISRTSLVSRASLVSCAALASCVLVPVAHAQAPQPDGGLPPRAIMRIVHSNGLDPVGRPVREGPTYVVRAINRRGVLMRVVVDASSGQVRAVNQIVPGPGGPARIAMRPAPYGPPPEFDPLPVAPDESEDMPPARAMRPPVTHAPPRATALAGPPLPRPRPANLVAETPPPAPPAETKPVAPAVVPEAESKAPPAAGAPPINE